MIMQEKFKNAIEINSKFDSIRRNSNIDYDIYRTFNAFQLNLTSIQKSPQNSHRPMGIHHSPHTHPIPIAIGIPTGISIPTATLEIPQKYPVKRSGYIFVIVNDLVLRWGTCMCSSSILVLKPVCNGTARLHRLPQHEFAADVHRGRSHLHAQPDGVDGDRRRADAAADARAGRHRCREHVRTADQRRPTGQRDGGRCACRRREGTTGQCVRRNTGNLRA